MTELEQSVPGLKTFRIIKPNDDVYNCVAWAVEKTDDWCWPRPRHYWPEDLTRTETLTSFREMFNSLGFEECDNEYHESGIQKVAIFAIQGKPTHAARQMKDGSWTSKIGGGPLIEHLLREIEGDAYGQIVMILKRAIT